MIDVNKLLQLDYLNVLILQINNTISEKKELFINEYSFDVIRSMNLDEINKLFNDYNVKNDNLLKYFESDFLDESWEYADLYSDDISYSSEQREKLLDLTLKEISNLNEKIILHNNKNQEEIDTLQADLDMLNIFIKTLNDDNLIVDDEIEKIKEFIINCSLIRDEDRFRLSVNVINYLIDNNKIILLKKEFVDTEEFEKELDEVRNNVLIDESNKNNRKVDDLPYGKLIDEYYEKYRELFDEYGYNDILEFMRDASNSYEDIGVGVKTISKDNFCIEIAGLLYQLNYYNDKEMVEDALTNLKALNDLYSINNQFDKYKRKMLEKVEALRVKLNNVKLDSSEDKIRLINRLKLLYDELVNNIFNEERKKEIDKNFDDLNVSIDKMFEKEKTLEKIELYNDKIKKLLSLPMIFELLGNEFYDELVGLQEKFLNLQKEISENGFSRDVYSSINSYIKILSNVENKLNSPSEEVTKQVLKGFVLFDVSENGQAYVVTDLDPSHKDRLIDKAIEPDKLRKGYEDYNKLVKDLHLIGTTERLSNNDSHAFNSDRLNEAVYFDTSNRSHENETGMYRLRYDRNGVERFVERRIVLHAGTKLCEQVTNIIKEILPYVEFDYSEDIALYINFASAMKLDDHDTYNQALKRYKKQSALYKMFIDGKNKQKKNQILSDEECKLLKDFVNLTLQSYIELEKNNSCLNFDIIRQMGGMKTRG